jgi:hypothetical protein
MATVQANFVSEIYRLFAANSTYDDAAAVSKETIIVTPHHIQRRAVTQATQSTDIEGANTVLVDTVGKTQGKTADFVIVCYGIRKEAELERDCDYTANNTVADTERPAACRPMLQRIIIVTQ